MKPMNSNVGYLYMNAVTKQHPKRPHISGKIVLPIDLLRHLLEAHGQRKDTSIKLAGWRRVTDEGNVFYSVFAKPTWQEAPCVSATIDDLFY